jgi:hypothetical protein
MPGSWTGSAPARFSVLNNVLEPRRLQRLIESEAALGPRVLYPGRTCSVTFAPGNLSHELAGNGRIIERVSAQQSPQRGYIVSWMEYLDDPGAAANPAGHSRRSWTRHQCGRMSQSRYSGVREGRLLMDVRREGPGGVAPGHWTGRPRLHLHGRGRRGSTGSWTRRGGGKPRPEDLFALARASSATIERPWAKKELRRRRSLSCMPVSFGPRFKAGARPRHWKVGPEGSRSRLKVSTLASSQA